MSLSNYLLPQLPPLPPPPRPSRPPPSHISKMTSLVDARGGWFTPHPVLHSVDLLTIILQPLGVSEEGHRTLARAAIVCRAWTEPALRALWRTGLGWCVRPNPLYSTLLHHDQYAKARSIVGSYTSNPCQKILDLVGLSSLKYLVFYSHSRVDQIERMEPGTMVPIPHVCRLRATYPVGESLPRGVRPDQLSYGAQWRGVFLSQPASCSLVARRKMVA